MQTTSRYAFFNVRPHNYVGAIAAIGTFAFLQLPVSAQTTVYTNRNSFLTAIGSGSTNIDFTAAATNGSITDYSTASGLTLSGVQFVGALNGGGNDLSVLTPSYYQTYQGWTGNPTILTGPGGSTPGVIQVKLPANVFAVGANFYTVAVGDGAANTVGPITMTLSNGTAFQFTTFSNPTLAFGGFTSTVAISSLTFQATSSNSTYPDISNFVYKQGTSAAAAAPEPGSIALLATSLLPLGGLAARRRRTAAGRSAA